MKRFLLALTLLAPLASLADAPSNSAEVSIFRGNTAKTVNLEDVKPKTVIRSKPPHRQLNPDGKIFEYSGVSLKRLLGLTKKDAHQLVSFVGIDGYISTVPASVLLHTNAILALSENGNRIEERRGGVQVIYPTEGLDAVEQRYATKAAFWCWYVRSIVVGDFSNAGHFGIIRPKDLSKTKSSSISFEPPSVFQFEMPPCPKSQRAPLSTLTKAQHLVLRSLSDQEKIIPTANFDVIFTTENQALPVYCGGPLALVDHSQSLAQPMLAKHIEINVKAIEERP